MKILVPLKRVADPDNSNKVKLAPGTTVTMLASSIQPLETATPSKGPDKELNDLKDAKALAEKK